MGNKKVNVFGDALIGIVRFTRQQLHPIVGTVGQPSPEIALGEPAPPADLEHLAKIKLVDGEKNGKPHKPGKAHKLLEKDGIIPVLQRGEECVVPLIKEDTEIDHPESECDDKEEQSPGCPALLRGPIRADHGPCGRKQPAQTRCGWNLRMMGSGNASSRMTGAMSFRILARWALTVGNSRIFPFISIIQLLAHWSPPQTLCLLLFRLAIRQSLKTRRPK